MNKVFPRSSNDFAQIKNIELGLYGKDVIADTNEHNVNGLDYVWGYIFNPTAAAITVTVTEPNCFAIGTEDPAVGVYVLQPGEGKYILPSLTIQASAVGIHAHRSGPTKGFKFSHLNSLINW